MSTFDTVAADIVERIVDLDARILDARRLEYNASQIGNAAAFGRITRIVESLYIERDGLAAEHPDAEFEARRRAAVARMSR